MKCVANIDLKNHYELMTFHSCPKVYLQCLNLMAFKGKKHRDFNEIANLLSDQQFIWPFIEIYN